MKIQVDLINVQQLRTQDKSVHCPTSTFVHTAVTPIIFPSAVEAVILPVTVIPRSCLEQHSATAFLVSSSERTCVRTTYIDININSVVCVQRRETCGISGSGYNSVGTMISIS